MALKSLLVDLQSYVSDIDKKSFVTEETRLKALAAARSLVNQLETPIDTLCHLAWTEPAYAACMKIALDIGLFAALGQNVQGISVGDLAKSTKCDQVLLRRVLRLLTGMGTIAQTGDDTFCSTKVSSSLLERSYSSAIDFRYLVSNPGFQHLPAFLKKTDYQDPNNLFDGPWQYSVQTKLSYFEWLGQNPDALEMFTNHMAGYSILRGTWEEVYPVQERILGGDVESANDILLVDLGGGGGHDIKRFASKFLPPTVQKPYLVLQDLPEVIDKVKGELPPSIQAVSVDFTKEAPVSNARSYYMHSVLHDWPDSDAQQMLRALHPTLLKQTTDGYTPKLLINENVFAKQGVSARLASLDVLMMAAFASRERTEEEWTSLLEFAGFRIVKIFSKIGVHECVIEAEAVDPG